MLIVVFTVFFVELADYAMSKPEGQKALAMRAIMRQIHAEQEKAHEASQARNGGSVDGPTEAAADPARPSSPVPLSADAVDDSHPISPKVVLKPPRSSVAKGKRPNEGGARSPVKKRTKHLGQKPHGEGDDRHVIDFPGNYSTREVSAEMILVVEGFFFPQDEEWLQSLSFSKFYEMTISSLHKVSLLLFSSYLVVLLIFSIFRGFKVRLEYASILCLFCGRGDPSSPSTNPLQSS